MLRLHIRMTYISGKDHVIIIRRYIEERRERQEVDEKNQKGTADFPDSLH